MKNVLQVPDRSLTEGLLQQEAELLRTAGLSDTEKLHYLTNPMKRLADQAIKMQKMLDETRHLELIQWLSSSPFTRHQEALSETRMANSATWLLDDPEYKNWRNSSSSSILLLHGIAGSGKSQACSAVVDSFLDERTANPLAAPVAYFYCADCEFEPERAQSDGVMRSILRQLTISSTGQPMVRNTILTEFERRLAQSKVDGVDTPKPTLNDCVRLILEVTAVDPVIIVMDGLDEINEHDRLALIHAVEQIVIESPNVVKVFLTSRNNSQVDSLLRNEKAGPQPVSTQACVKSIEINRDNTLQDMKTYVQLALKRAVRDRRLLKTDPSPELWDILVEKLVPGAGEIFQWVNVQIEYLTQFDTEEHITAVLRKGTLATLDDTYDLILGRILSRRDTSRDIAVRALSWLLYMREAISPDAFLSAVFSQTNGVNSTRSQKELVTICSGLVLFDSKCNTFRFSHHSVQEFLRTQTLFSPASAHGIIATSCLNICMTGPSVEPANLDALYWYSALYWAYHSSRAAIPNDQGNLGKMITLFVYDGPGYVSLSFMGWLDHIASISVELADDHPMKTATEAIPNPEGSPLFVASIFGLDCLLRDIGLGVNTTNWDQRNDHGHTSLYLACASGSQSAALTLLDHGADPNAECGRFGNPLQAACFAGHVTVVELLLKNGALVYEKGAFSNALQACVKGHKEEAAKVLLKSEDIIRSVEEFDFALGCAAQAGFLEVVEWLHRSPLASQYGSEYPDKMKMKTTRAIQGGNTSVLERFLKNRPRPTDLLPDGPMAVAAIYGHESIIELLSGMNIDLEGECMLGSPLRCAALMGRERIMRKLIELGADINGCGQHGTALQAASMKGHIQIVEFLLRSGAKINQTGGMYGTALQAASYLGHLNVVEVLLDAGAQIHIAGISKDAFHGAAEGGHYDIVRVMLDRGFQFCNPPIPLLCNEGRQQYRSLLRDYSQSRGDAEALESVECDAMTPNTKYMRSRSDEMSYQDVFSVFETSETGACPGRPERPQVEHQYENYALEVSAANGYLRVVSILLEYKSDLGISDNSVLDALKMAAKYGHTEVFHLISGALPTPLPIGKFLKALEEAAVNSHVDILNSTIEQLSIEDWGTGDLQALLGLSCRTTCAVVEKLLSAVAKTYSAASLDKALESGLVKAATYGNADVFNFLLEKGGDFEQKTICRAFEAACRGGHSTLAYGLLQAADEDAVDELISKGLDASASSGHVNLVIYLVNHLTSTGKKVKLVKPLFAATQSGRLDVVKALLQRRDMWESYAADITCALIIASFNGHDDIVEAFITAGADFNALLPNLTIPFDRNKWPDDGLSDPLFSGSEQINALQAALEGIKQLQDSYPIPPQEEKSVSNLERTVKILLDNGADANGLGGCKEHPIIVAAGYCSVRVVSWLIDAGADVNAMIEGKNAVLAAVERELSSAGVLRRLLQAGAHLQTDAWPIDRLFSGCLDYFLEDGQFIHTKTLEDAMTEGPGAVAQMILKALPSVEAKHKDFQGLLQVAIALNDRPCIELLLQRRVNINSTGCYYGTALQAAAWFGRFGLVQRLLEAGADPNIVQGHHGTALRAAVLGRHAEVVRVLLQYNANVNLGNDPDSLSKTLAAPLLNLAVESNSSEIVSTLVSSGIDVAGPLEHNDALILACASGNLELVKCLLESGAPAGVVGKRFHGLRNGRASPFHMACHHGHEDLVRLFLDRGVDVDMEVGDSGTPLQLAANSGHVGPILLLLQAGADVNRIPKNKRPALSAAATHGNVNPIRLLLQAGADVDCVANNKETALSIAASCGHLDAVRELLDAGATIYEPQKRKNALISACHSRSLMVLELLLEAASDSENRKQAILEALDVVVKDNYGEMLGLISTYMEPSVELLHKACIAGSLPLITMLLDKGVPVDEEDESGARALDLAAHHLQVDVVKLLVGRGANVNHGHPAFGNALSAAIYGCVKDGLPQEARPEQDRTQRVSSPLTLMSGIQGLTSSWKPNIAQTSRCEEIVRFLIHHGTAVAAEPRVFGLPLHLASFLGNMKIIRLLFSAGASIHSAEGCFRTPLFAALFATIHRGHLEPVELLLREGSDVNYAHPGFGTPLFLAVGMRKIPLVLVLLDFGGDPNAIGPDGSSLLARVMAEPTSDFGVDGKINTSFFEVFLNKAKGLKIRNHDLVQAAQIPLYIRRYPVLDLLHHNKDIIVPEEAVVASLDAYGRSAHDQKKILDALLEHNPNIPITEPTFLAIFGGPRLISRNKFSNVQLFKDLVKTLQEYGKKFKYTDEVRQAIDTIVETHPEMAIRELFSSLEETAS